MAAGADGARKPWVRILPVSRHPWPGVELTGRQLGRAAVLGRQHFEQSGGGPRCGVTLDPDLAMHLDIISAYGEFAVAGYFGLPKPDEQSTGVLDVGQKAQVRTVTCQTYRLVHRPSDNPAHVYIQVLAWPPFFYLRGWLPGFACRKDEWHRTPNGRPPFWLVPVDALCPITDLEAGLL